MGDVALYARVEALENEVSYLRSELGLSIHSTHIRALRDLGLSTHHARVVMALRSAKGRTLSVFQIGDAADLTPLSAKVSVCESRRWVPGIVNQRGAGYHLTKEGQAFVDDILEREIASCGGLATVSHE